MAKVLATVPLERLSAVTVTVELVIESGVLSAEHVENVLARLTAVPEPARVETTLELKKAPLANASRYDSLREGDLGSMEVNHARYDRRTQGTAPAWHGQCMD